MRLLRDWNDTDHAVEEASLPALFAAQAQRTPDAVAIAFEDRSLSYAELDRRANQLAHHLQSLGVGPEAIVGLCVERSPEMVIGLLGILKAGGAYLPLDPEYPAERLAFMLADAGASLLVTQSLLLGRLPAHGAQTIKLDADWPDVARQPTSAPKLELHPQHPAYVIYTSGSTGTPKGVVVSHGGLQNFLLSMHERLALASADRLLAVTTLGFDIAALELFLPLICGAGVAIAAHEIAQRSGSARSHAQDQWRHHHAGHPDAVAGADGPWQRGAARQAVSWSAGVAWTANAGGRRGAPCCARARSARAQ